MKLINSVISALCLVSALSLSAIANDQLVSKQVYQGGAFTFFNGQQIDQFEVGWQSYGELNEEADNAILITHFFSGSSHVAGRYEDGGALGYWDAIVGPGKAIDTDKYFVISIDTLVNQEPHNPYVTTTGPASINPNTGQAYALEFPVVTIRDFVNVQKEVLESLGIERLHAVIGASMGSLQALEWAVAYPDKVDRMVSVIGMAQTDPWTLLSLQQWAEPILNDPNWDQGNYYSQRNDDETTSVGPQAGLRQSIMQISLQAMHPRAINAMFSDFNTLDTAALEDPLAVHPQVEWLRQRASERARYADANHILYLIRANQLFIAGMQDNLDQGLARLQASALFMPAKNDLLLHPSMARHAHESLLRLGKESQYVEIEGDWGHLDGLVSIATQADRLKTFLAEKRQRSE
ncbi:E22 family MetX-like putative esterase [Aliidiomarina soli]|uniref:Probable acyltransferase n=1 Tax=Aliidiomarina soli TaxID=1928574 RepID=A0A432WE68_9GAMM|nr:homoserine O-acetyltransferase [Aliidiomarina soli]RUO31187.1 homoserine acetyltransferase [Aliidiomarina soli]